MKLDESIASSDGYLAQADLRKRLGQYFTGVGLGRVLAALSFAQKASSVIDPMEGSGDLIAAALELGAKPGIVAGIEIDPRAYEVAQRRLPQVAHFLGSAFDPSVLRRLPTLEWDLVITNPPYVRYQSMTKVTGTDFRLPGSVEVRNDLMASLAGMPALDEEDRRLFSALVANYSGLSDLAVPSWILCASMVRIGGRLALVVPESWLSREYAAVVQYLLLRWFEIEHLVEDEHAAWFSDAQVKTTLLVARRIKRRSTAFGWADKRFVRSRISGAAAGADGPIAGLFPGRRNQEIMLARIASGVQRSNAEIRTDLLTMSSTPIATMAGSLYATARRQRWFELAGEPAAILMTESQVPHALSEWLQTLSATPVLTSLESLDIAVGQGLRTGANGFFYATLISENKRTAIVEPEGVPGIGPIRVLKTCLRPVLRNQSDLPLGHSVPVASLTGRVFDLRRMALPEDIANGGVFARQSYVPMPPSVADYVRKADAANFGNEQAPRRIRERTAVAPNMRLGDPTKGVAPRFWYMLPDYAPRHMPDLLVPRINAGLPKAFILAERGVLVDANFSTLNVPGTGGVSVYALLALLNSLWCQVFLEHSAAVMGGGALKVEAVHLRKMLVPRLSASQWHQLAAQGKRLAESGSGLLDANQLIVTALLGRECRSDEIMKLSQLASEAKHRRGGHKKKGAKRDEAI